MTFLFSDVSIRKICQLTEAARLQLTSRSNIVVNNNELQGNFIIRIRTQRLTDRWGINYILSLKKSYEKIFPSRAGPVLLNLENFFSFYVATKVILSRR